MEQANMDLVMAHAVRTPKVAAALLQLGLTPADMSGFAYAHYAAVWDVVSATMRASNVLPTPEVFVSLLQSKITGDNALLVRTLNLVLTAYKVPAASLQPDLLIQMDLVEKFVRDLKVDPLLHQIGAAATTESRIAAMSEAAAAFERTKLVMAQEENIFDLSKLDQYAYGEMPPPSGVAWIDAICDGIFPGSTVGLLAGSGGGKTTAAVQMACENVLRKRHTAFFTYEQNVKGNLATRFWAYMTGIPLGAMRCRPEAFPPEFQEHFMRVSAEYAPYLHLYDMAGTYVEQGRGGALEYERIIETLEEKEGQAPTLTVLDWLGTMVTATREDVFSKASAASDTSRHNFMLSELSRMIQRHNSTLLVCHQLAPAAIEGKCPRFKPDKYSAKDCKSFPMLMQYVFTFGLHDKGATGCMWANGAKTRDREGGSRIVRLDGAGSKIVDVHDTMQETIRGTGGDPFEKRG